MAGTTPSAPLRLRAADPEDLSVVAACLQDALVPIGDMTYLPEEQRFVFVANRFRWEAGGLPGAASGQSDETGDASYADAAGPHFERTNCGVWFDGVLSVRTKGVNLRNRGQILELLTLRHEPGRLILVFAGGATILLETEGLRCFLEDIGEPWPTRWRPDHPAIAGEGPGQ